MFFIKLLNLQNLIIKENFFKKKLKIFKKTGNISKLVPILYTEHFDFLTDKQGKRVVKAVANFRKTERAGFANKGGKKNSKD
jgi:hypothetical protein